MRLAADTIENAVPDIADEKMKKQNSTFSGSVKRIFENVIKEYLKDKTVLVCTHALQYIPMMDYVIHMIKNLSEAMYYCAIVEAMEKGENTSKIAINTATRGTAVTMP